MPATMKKKTDRVREKSKRDGAGRVSVLQENTVLLTVEFHLPLMSRPASNEVLRDDVEDKCFHVRKEILDSQYYRDMKNVRKVTRAWLTSVAPKPPFFSSGSYLVAVGCVPDVERYLSDRDGEFTDAKESFLSEYESRKRAAKKDLRDEYREEDYPTPEELEEAIYLDWDFLEVSAPSAGKIGSSLRSKARALSEKKWAEAEKMWAAGLRSTMSELLRLFADGLGMRADGSKAAVLPATYEKVERFFDLFSKRNILNDRELASQAKKIQDLLVGRDADTFKEDDVREAAAKVVEAVRKNLGDITTVVPGGAAAKRRVVSFD